MPPDYRSRTKPGRNRRHGLTSFFLPHSGAGSFSHPGLSGGKTGCNKINEKPGRRRPCHRRFQVTQPNQNIVSTALPTIVGEIGGLTHLSWIVTAYLLSTTVVVPLYGKLGDVYGR